MDPAPAAPPVPARLHRPGGPCVAAALLLAFSVAASNAGAQAVPQPGATAPNTAARPHDAEFDAGLELYRYKLMQTGSKLPGYPKEAQEHHLTGTALVQLRVGADGLLQSETLLHGTGHRSLDQYALGFLAQAIPLTEIPPALQNSPFELQVTLVFALPE